MTTAAIYYSACGRGHQVRSQALADALRSKGLSVHVEELAPARSALVYADVTVLDLHPSVQPEFQASRRLVVIVDGPPLNLPDPDLLVCGGAGAIPGHPIWAGAKRVLAGPEYALLRPEFANERRYSHVRRGVLDLRKVENLNPKTLAIEMAGAQVAITYGGMRAMEATCVGTPTVIYPRNDGEHLNARGLVAAGCAIIADESELGAVAREFVSRPDVLADVSKACLALVDGLGVSRVAQAIAELL